MTDEAEFDRDEFYDDQRRAMSPEWDYGVHWKLSDDGPNWPLYRVSWVVETGELYAIRSVDDMVTILGVIPKVGEYPYGRSQDWTAFKDAQTVEKMLDGWALAPRSLDWIRRRIA